MYVFQQNHSFKEKNHGSCRFLVEANDKSEWLLRVYVKFGIIGNLISNSILWAISFAAYLRMNEKFDAKYVYHEYRLM